MAISDPRLPDNPIVFANEAFQMLTGYSREEVLGRNCRFLQGPATDPASVAVLRRAVDAGEAAQVDLLNYRKDGSTFWNALYLSPVRGADGATQFFFASQLDITERVEAQAAMVEQKTEIERLVHARTAELETALDAKTTLLKEVDHRVKNNLAMIGALLRLQARSPTDQRLRTTLDNMLERIDALAAVHRRLYQSEDVGKFDVGAFAAELANTVIGASGRADIDLRTDVDVVEIDATKASAVGLVINKLVTNAIKHGFADGRPGRLALRVRLADTAAEIALHDDGPGFDTAAPVGDTIGRVLVERLARQIGATVRWDGAAPGTRVLLHVPLAS